jgi:peptidoglycan/LPS O-acetylase OafA/YrhL
MSRRYIVLDGLRGVAALAVFIFHTKAISQIVDGTAFLAVDLFFLLSGFVVSSAYEDKLARGMSVGGFMRIRLIRLYPLYLLGAAMAITALIVSDTLGRNPGGHDILLPAVLTLLFLPLVDGGPLYPLNGPSWSLMNELIVNAIYAVLQSMLTTVVLVVICMLSDAGLIALAIASGTVDLGWTGATAAGGLSRVLFFFFLGVLLWRLKRSDRLRRLPNVSAMFLLIAAGTLLVVPSGFALPRQIVTVTILFPVLMALAVCRERGSPQWLATAMAAGGILSYPLYCIQSPILGVLQNILNRFGLEDPRIMLLGTPLAVLTAFGLGLYYDDPARAWLTGPSRSRHLARVI